MTEDQQERRTRWATLSDEEIDALIDEAKREDALRDLINMGEIDYQPKPNLEHAGIVETRHMAETGEPPSPAFDEAARAAARAAGLSDEEIDDMLGPDPYSRT